MTLGKKITANVYLTKLNKKCVILYQTTDIKYVYKLYMVFIFY